LKAQCFKTVRHITRLAIFLIALFSAKTSYAFDFEEILRRAEQIDPQLASVAESRRGASTQYNSVSRPATPIVNLGLNSQGYFSSLDGIPGVPPGRQKFGAGYASVSIAQSIFNPLRQINIDEAGLRVEFETIQFQAARNDLAVKTLQTLLNFINATDALDNSLEELRLIKKMIVFASTKDSGIDGSIYQIRLVQAEGQASLTRSTLDQRNREILRLIGTNTNTELKPLWAEDFDTATLLPSIEELFGVAEENNLLLRQQSIMLKLAEAGIRRTSRNSFPSVDLVVNGSSARGMPTYPSAMTQSASAGIQINIPIGDSGIGSIMKTDALMQESRARSEIESTKKTIQQSISDSYYEYKNAIIQIGTEIKVQQLRKTQEPKYKGDDLSPESIAEKISNLEEEIVRNASGREQRRLQRDALIQKVRIWAACGELNERQLRQISMHFISLPSGK